MRQPHNWTQREYASAHSDELPHDISVLEKEIAPSRVKGIYHGATLKRVRWKLCDFGILLFDTELTLPLSEVSETSAKKAEGCVQDIARQVAESVIQDDYLALKSLLETQSDWERFVDFSEDEPFEAGWTSRALVFDPDDSSTLAAHKEFALFWIGKDFGGGSTLIERLASQETKHVAEWMNYVYLAESASLHEPEALKQMWTALCRAQFFYAAMAKIDSKLMNILAWAMADPTDVSTAQLKAQLRRSMDLAEALFLKKAEVGKYVNPHSRQETERILKVWNFQEVLVDPVRMKLDICQSRLDAIDRERARSSAFFTDLILMVIGVTSILGTALAVVGLGRGASSDPNQAMYDLGAGQLTTWISAQPIDVILLISTIVSVLMILAFVLARRSSDT